MMSWEEISGHWVLFPTGEVKAILHFLGGAFVGTLPNITYRWLLEELVKDGYCIVATPFEMSLDHRSIARNVLSRWESLEKRWQNDSRFSSYSLPVYGIGHSMGCKLHLLIGTLHQAEERAGNILISYNNYPIKKAIPLFKELELDKNLNLEFVPDPKQTRELITQDYQVRRNLLIYFDNDDIDQTLDLRPILLNRFPGLTSALRLPGSHLTPCSQDISFYNRINIDFLQSTNRWLKEGLSRDLYRLKDEMLIWLNPTSRIFSN
jgi:hypothetical protein